MYKVNDQLYSWASILDDNTLEQAETIARLPIIAGHVALMPDAHLGKGSTVGSVIPTKGAVIPAAIGVDIGCGMIASLTNLDAYDLPDSLDGYVRALGAVVPAGLGKWHSQSSEAADKWMANNINPNLTSDQLDRAHVQLGTMGGGNHFFEVCLDQRDRVWIIMHSGSRGIGNQLAVKHMAVAKSVCDYNFMALRGQKGDNELAWLEEGTPEFSAYINDMLWAQAYALQNRSMMMDAAIKAFFKFLGAQSVGQFKGRLSSTGASFFEEKRINSHHNFTQREEHDGMMIWVTRKGAVRAGTNDEGLIPGSMGGISYVVKGLGNELSYESCAHGAGRKMSRGQAKRTFDINSLRFAMEGVSWQNKDGGALIDEHPGSYKPIDVIMDDQKDLVRVKHKLKAIANYKGVS